MAPQDTKPLESKHYEDVRLAGHLEDDIKDSPSSHAYLPQRDSYKN